MLIIYAHPDNKGHCGYILELIEKELADKATKYTILDLYKDEFDPVMQADELYTHGGRKISAKVEEYQKILKTEDKIIIIYPTWWNSAPAILKGFFDKVLTSHYAFKYIKGLPIGLLKGKVAVITTTGGPAFYQKIFAQNRSLKTVVNSTLKFCGFKAKGFLVGSANKLSDSQKVKIEKTVSKLFKYLD